MRNGFLAAAAMALLAAPVAALADGEPGQGRAIAVEHCAKCHAVPGHEAKGAMDIAPGFAAIADGLDAPSEARIRSFLGRPHWPMRQITLSPSDIDNIVAYLESLRP